MGTSASTRPQAVYKKVNGACRPISSCCSAIFAGGASATIGNTGHLHVRERQPARTTAKPRADGHVHADGSGRRGLAGGVDGPTL